MDMKKARLTSLLLACAMLTACGSKTPEADGGNSAAETTTSPVMTVAVGTSEALPATTTAPAEEATEPVTTVPPDDMTRVHDISLTFYTTELKVGNKTMPYVTMSPETAVNKDEIWKSSDEKIATVDSIGNITGVSEGECTVTVTSADNPAVSAEVKVIVKAQEGLTYFDGILVANKSYPLPADYNPGGLLPETQAAFDKLVAGAARDGINIYLSSGFRSYEYQSEIYGNYCDIYGQETADTFSARPGYSEHQTGMAIDVNIIDDSFAGTPEAEWIEKHCNEYGFILRYPPGKQAITGYKYESWHIRYVGEEFAKKLADKAAEVGDPYYTIEEYFDIDSVYKD